METKAADRGCTTTRKPPPLAAFGLKEDAAGKRERFTADTWREVRRWLDRDAEALAYGSYRTPGKIKLRAYIEDWRGMHKSSYRVSTWRDYVSVLRTWLLPGLGDVRFDRLDARSGRVAEVPSLLRQAPPACCAERAVKSGVLLVRQKVVSTTGDEFDNAYELEPPKGRLEVFGKVNVGAWLARIRKESGRIPEGILKIESPEPMNPYEPKYLRMLKKTRSG
ncbi:MAG TPA: hypothetical protein VLU25_11570 [Acidobacteriota bacterium]|nr:hypothetical protein [Acidobacteriota bacterium]